MMEGILKLCFKRGQSGEVINGTMHIVKVGRLTKLGGIEELVLVYVRNFGHGNVPVLIFAELIKWS